MTTELGLLGTVLAGVDLRLDCPTRIDSREELLLGRALSGDGRAFSELVEPHLAMMFRIAARVVSKNRCLAEDAVQEALTLAYVRLRSYRPGSSLRAFLAAIAARKASTLLRSELRRRRREVDAEPFELQVPTPADTLDAERTAQALRQALGALPNKRRQVALLRLDGGLSYAEIAESLHTSEASARNLTHLALASLEKALLTAGAVSNPRRRLP
jgi:RNA polymerase sigma-70 factor (ECF subfamily)